MIMDVYIFRGRTVKEFELQGGVINGRTIEGSPSKIRIVFNDGVQIEITPSRDRLGDFLNLFWQSAQSDITE